MESTILVTGGSGRLGKIFSGVLSEKNITHTLTSRTNPFNAHNWMPMDIGSGNGIDAAMQGKKVVIHLASDTKKYDQNIDVCGTQRLLDAAKKQGIEHFIYISIVGIDQVPTSYYKIKLQTEAVIKQSGVPYTILRATQFHEFLDQMFHQYLKWLVIAVPTTAQLQPIDTIVVAQELFRLMQLPPSNQTYNQGGPEILELGILLSDWQKAQHKLQWVLHLPALGKTLKALKNGGLTCPDHCTSGITWKEWLNKKYTVEKA